MNISTLCQKVSQYASLVKFSHSVFAMPFALASFTYAYTTTTHSLSLILLFQVIACMVFARNAAMAFNRYADRKIDALNVRTSGREIPAGIISAKSALLFVIINSLLFVAVTATINNLCLLLSPIALIIILGYSYAKRFTCLCHLIIGLALSIAPVGAYIAVVGNFDALPIVLAGAVLSWVAGFDIIYSLQDMEFDDQHNLNSIPSRLGAKGALIVSSLLHLTTIIAIIIVGVLINAGLFYITGCIIFSILMIYQHHLVKADDFSKINLAFGTVNGCAGVIFGLSMIADLLI